MTLPALKSLLDAMPEAMSLADATSPDHPLVYVNPAFERLTGYPASALLGRNLRFLQGDDRDQAGRRRLREAVDGVSEGRALLRNFRRDGSSFWHDVQITPVRDAEGVLTHWLGVHHAAAARAQDPREFTRPVPVPAALVEDSLTRLKTRGAFEAALVAGAGAAERQGVEIALFAGSMDAFEPYVETFTRQGADAAVRQIGRALAALFRRSTDVLARWQDGTFVAFAVGLNVEQAAAHAERMRARVRDLRLHHPRGGSQRYVTFSVGVAVGVPSSGGGDLLSTAFSSLSAVQARGGDQADATLLLPPNVAT